MSSDAEANSNWALVTGAASGIGASVAARCVADGYNVLAIDRNADGLARLAEQHGEAISSLEADLSRPDLGDVVIEKFRALGLEASPADSGGAGLGGLVNVAGISQGDSIDGITDGDWQLSMDVNATAPMRLVRALLPLLEAAEHASIVNVASPVAIVGARKVSYSASKGALLGLNAALTQNLGPRGIRVNAVLPGPTITGMTNDWPEEKRQAIASGSPLGRLCRPQDVAGAVSFLLSQDAAYVTGSVLNVTGGQNVGV